MAQGGDSEASDALFRRHQQAAYRFAFRLAHEENAASDLVAESFYRAYRGLRGYRNTGPFAAWLNRIMTRCWIDMRTGEFADSLSLIEEIEPDEMRTPWEASAPHGVLDTVERQERAMILLDAIESLPDIHRDAIVQFYLKARTYKDIAQTTHKPVGTIKSRMNRALRELRTVLLQQRTVLQP